MKTALRTTWMRWSLILLATCFANATRAEHPVGPVSAIRWADGYLTISGTFPGRKIQILYLEAYCRPGSTDRDWSETVIGHTTDLVESSEDRQRIKLRDRLRDGVVVDHHINARGDEVDFRLVAHNPTDKQSQAHWAQPCVRVHRFTGCTTSDARARVPDYARKSFIFLDGQLTRLPTSPWAETARYIPGQVYRPSHVARDDVNPRPLSVLVPSNGLIGCFSEDGRQILAMAWQPYQELFLGVITCIHSDFRIGGLAAGASKEIRGKLYLVDADVSALVERYERDFPEHVPAK